MPENYKFNVEKKYLLISNFFGCKKRHGGVKRAHQIKEIFDTPKKTFQNKGKSKKKK